MEDIVTASSLGQPLKERLRHAKLTARVQLYGIRVSLLAKELKVANDEAVAFKREIDIAFGWAQPAAAAGNATVTPAPALSSSSAGSAAPPVGFTALELLQRRRSSTSAIVTFCKELDDVLGGGVQLGEVTEFCGIPGVGKTQLCMQLALTVQIPKDLGGVQGSAAYIDAEGSMMPHRLEEMATALHKHLQSVARRMEKSTGNSLILARVNQLCAPSHLLQNVRLSRVTDLGEQMAAIAGLHRFLERNRDVRLVILDSVAFHFRYGDGDMGSDLQTRSRILQNLSLQLHRVAAEFDVAVVVVNQMTTRIDGSRSSLIARGTSERRLEDGGGSEDHRGTEADGTSVAFGGSAQAHNMVPALGETWAHACTNRVILRFDDLGARVAQLVKSPSRVPGIARFLVSGEGIRGIKAASGGGGSKQASAAAASGAAPVAQSSPSSSSALLPAENAVTGAAALPADRLAGVKRSAPDG